MRDLGRPTWTSAPGRVGIATAGTTSSAASAPEANNCRPNRSELWLVWRVSFFEVLKRNQEENLHSGGAPFFVCFERETKGNTCFWQVFTVHVFCFLVFLVQFIFSGLQKPSFFLLAYRSGWNTAIVAAPEPMTACSVLRFWLYSDSPSTWKPGRVPTRA